MVLDFLTENMTKQDATLAAKVKAQNYVNAWAIDLTPKVLKALEPFLAQKIGLTTGGMSAKLGKVLNAFQPEGTKDRVWFTFGHGYNLTMTLKTCEMVEGCPFCVYAEQTVYLGDIKTGFLTALHEKSLDLRTDRTVGEIKMLRRAVEYARDSLHKAEFMLAGFGEHDNG